MVGETVAADVYIMNAAMNNGSLGATKVASAANPLRLRLRCDWPCLDGARLHVKPASAREGPDPSKLPHGHLISCGGRATPPELKWARRLLPGTRVGQANTCKNASDV